MIWLAQWQSSNPEEYGQTDINPLRAEYTMTSSNGTIFNVTGPLCGEFTGPGEIPTQRPVMQSFEVFFDLRLNKRLSKQPWNRDLRRHRGHYDVNVMYINGFAQDCSNSNALKDG